ncbi:hypothetical protein CSB45_10705 [candidate division KSB3 bacterium]|uniref:PEGA domain-containing protein n=1 Tax=candidate division KSB3 bacterium TaxID=2044937 RepID=A0A2G6E3N5_9BACT|nr:MAG: hypothetical protein CSB45_10705 [candidate division KSB3 bacterium]PIE29122.1 MAG: hypothetical protein CSA57_09920 [candidate division KSB3 bacterium]
MKHDQAQYDPLILNLTKKQTVTQPKIYIWLFLSSIILLSALLVLSAWYLLFYANTPETSAIQDEAPGAEDRIPRAAAEPTPLPTATPEVSQTPLREEATPLPTKLETPQAEQNIKAQTGYLSLNSLPEQADIIINGELIGQTPLHEYELEAGNYSITFKFNDQSFTQDVSINAGERTEYTHRLEGLGSLHIATTSSGCEVYLNGRLRGESPLLLEGLFPGEYTIVLKKLGYHTVEKRVVLGKGEHQELFLTVRRLGKRDSPGSGSSPTRVLHPNERLRN